MRKRDFLKVLGGGTILAAAPGCTVLRPTPERALAPWSAAGDGHADPRKRALSWAILAPNPHNRQPWIVDLAEPDRVTLYVDVERQLPATDPHSRQITIGLGCLVEPVTLAAAADGYAVSVAPFPEGSDPTGALDRRPVATATFRPAPSAGPGPGPLFAHALARRSVKEPFDTARRVSPDVIDVARAAAVHGSTVDGTMAPLHERVHAMLAPGGGTVQMLARLGHAAPVPPSPRWSLDAVLARPVPVASGASL